MGQLLDVVHQAEQPPLRADLVLATQREAGEPLVVAQVAEGGLHGGDALAVELPPARAVDSRTHALDELVGIVRDAVVHGDLALRGLRLANALGPQRAALAVAGAGLEVLPLVAPGGVQRAAAAQGAAGRAGAGVVAVEDKVGRAEVALDPGVGAGAGLRLSCSTSPLALCLARSA